MIIGITGNKGTGKDTIANHLQANYGFTKVGFADSLYEAVCALFDTDQASAERWKNDANIYVAIQNEWPLVSRNPPLSFREFLQRMGTEVGRNIFGENFWVDQLASRIMTDEKNYVIKDVRFLNEAKMVDDFAGCIWRVIRPGYNGDDHVSETQMTDISVEMEIQNAGEIHLLYEAVDEIMENYYGYERISA